MNNNGIVSEVIDDKTTPDAAHRRPTKLDLDQKLVKSEREIASGKHDVTEPMRALDHAPFVPAYWFMMGGALAGYIALAGCIAMRLAGR